MVTIPSLVTAATGEADAQKEQEYKQCITNTN